MTNRLSDINAITGGLHKVDRCTVSKRKKMTTKVVSSKKVLEPAGDNT